MAQTEGQCAAVHGEFGELLCGENRVRERGEMGRGECSDARGSPLETEARVGEKRGSWARGLWLGQFQQGE